MKTISLAPSKLYPEHFPQPGGSWYRLARLGDGTLILEAISAKRLTHLAGRTSSIAWDYCGEVPVTIAAKLRDDSPDSVALVFDEVVDAFWRSWW
jgi:hypothetical protein